MLARMFSCWGFGLWGQIRDQPTGLLQADCNTLQVDIGKEWIL